MTEDFGQFRAVVARMRSSLWWSTVPTQTKQRGVQHTKTGTYCSNHCRGEIG